MTTPAFEKFLARLYTDPVALQRFLKDPGSEARLACLTEHEIAALRDCDMSGLRMAANSFARKRASYQRRNATWRDRLLKRIYLWLRKPPYF